MSSERSFQLCSSITKMDDYRFWWFCFKLRNFYLNKEINWAIKRRWVPGKNHIQDIKIPNLFHGIEQIEEREIKRQKKQIRIIENLDDKIISIFQWSLWNQIMDPDFAILSTCCGRTWWFDCLINSLKTEPNCPNCQTEIMYQMFGNNHTLNEIYNNLVGKGKKFKK